MGNEQPLSCSSPACAFLWASSPPWSHAGSLDHEKGTTYRDTRQPSSCKACLIPCCIEWLSIPAIFLLQIKEAELFTGVAALLELASEPLYILAQCRLLIGLRVKIEAAATIAKIVATLGLIWSQLYSEAIALSVSQASCCAKNSSLVCWT